MSDPSLPSSFNSFMPPPASTRSQRELQELASASIRNSSTGNTAPASSNYPETENQPGSAPITVELPWTLDNKGRLNAPSLGTEDQYPRQGSTHTHQTIYPPDWSTGVGPASTWGPPSETGAEPSSGAQLSEQSQPVDQPVQRQVPVSGNAAPASESQNTDTNLLANEAVETYFQYKTGAVQQRKVQHLGIVRKSAFDKVVQQLRQANSRYYDNVPKGNPLHGVFSIIVDERELNRLAMAILDCAYPVSEPLLWSPETTDEIIERALPRFSESLKSSRAT